MELFSASTAPLRDKKYFFDYGLTALSCFSVLTSHRIEDFQNRFDFFGGKQRGEEQTVRFFIVSQWRRARREDFILELFSVSSAPPCEIIRILTQREVRRLLPSILGPLLMLRQSYRSRYRKLRNREFEIPVLERDYRLIFKKHAWFAEATEADLVQERLSKHLRQSENHQRRPLLRASPYFLRSFLTVTVGEPKTGFKNRS